MNKRILIAVVSLVVMLVVMGSHTVEAAGINRQQGQQTETHASPIQKLIDNIWGRNTTGVKVNSHNILGNAIDLTNAKMAKLSTNSIRLDTEGNRVSEIELLGAKDNWVIRWEYSNSEMSDCFKISGILVEEGNRTNITAKKFGEEEKIERGLEYEGRKIMITALREGTGAVICKIYKRNADGKLELLRKTSLKCHISIKDTEADNK